MLFAVKMAPSHAKTCFLKMAFHCCSLKNSGYLFLWHLSVLILTWLGLGDLPKVVTLQ